MDNVGNDNDLVRPDDGKPDADAHGRAAILLVESLIHGLVARSLISPLDAAEIVSVASDVGTEMEAELDGGPSTIDHTLAILRAIGDSIDIDVVDDA